MDGDAVGGEGRVVDHHEFDTQAVDDLRPTRLRGLDGDHRSPAEGRRRGGLFDHLELDGGLIEDRREEARATRTRGRVTGWDGVRTHEVALDAALVV